MNKKFIYFLVCLGSFTISFNVAAITAAIPVISQELNLSGFIVSSIITYYLIPYGFGALLYAPMTRFFTYRRILATTMFLYGIACLSFIQTNELVMMQLSRLLMGVTGASAIPLGLMVIGDIFDKQIRGRLVGFFFSCSFVSSLLGIIVGGLFHWKWIFIIPAVISFVLLLLIIFGDTALLKHKHSGHINYLKVLKEKSILEVFSFIFILSFLYHAVHKWYGVYLSQEYGLESGAISFYFTLTVIGGMCGQICGGFISDLKDRFTTCMIGLLGLGVGISLLKFHHGPVILGFVLFFISFFWTTGHNGFSTILTDFPAIHRPAIASLNSSIRFISGGLGFQLSAYFVSQSFSLTFFSIGILIVLLNVILKRIVPNT